jgi:hypothetical protein
MASTVTVEAGGTAPYALGSTVYFTAKLDGVGKFMNLYVNGIHGGNSTVGTINDQNGVYHAPTVMPAGNVVTVTAVTTTSPKLSGNLVVPLRLAPPDISSISPLLLTCGQPFTLTVAGKRFDSSSVVWINAAAAPTTFVSSTKLTATGLISNPNSTVAVKVVNMSNGSSVLNYSVKVGDCPTPSPVIGPRPAPDAATVSAARFLEHATFGPTSADIALVKSIGPAAWITQQLAAPASAMPVGADLGTLRNSWYRTWPPAATNCASA